MPNKTKLVLNISPIDCPDATLSIGILQYHDQNQLKTLRDAHQLTHIFRRSGNRIETVAVVQDAEPIGDTFDTVRLFDNLHMAAALIRNALLNYLHRLGREVFGYDPLRFLAGGRKDNLLEQAFSQGAAAAPWLSITPKYTMSVRVFTFANAAPFVGLALDVSTSRRIRLRCDTLLAKGLSITGLYVGRELQSADPRIMPKLELVGRVREIVDGRLLLEDTRDEQLSISAADAVLEPRREAVDRCLAHMLGVHAAAVAEKLALVLSEVHTGPGRLERLKRVVEHLGQQQLEMCPGVSCRVQGLLEQGQRPFPMVLEAPRARYIFDPASSKTDTWHDRGLKTYGPYTSRTFTPSRPKFAVLCQKRYKGQVEAVMHKFLHGIQGGDPQKSPFAQGFIRKYGLEDCSAEFVLVADDSALAYERAIRDALRIQGERGSKWDLVFVQIEERFHALQGNTNPYLVTKAAFLSEQIPVQEFEIETIATSSNQLGYVLNNMGLAIYAKLGGIPWLIQASPTIAHELVVGLGSAQVGSGRLGKQERIVGITTVFTGDGRYHLASLSQATPMNEYREALYSSLRTTITKVSQDFNWQPNDHIRLVFHAFKDFKGTEADAVKRAVRDLQGYDLEFAFLHVADNHPFLVFDVGQLGVPERTTSTMKGTFAPARGQLFQLSDKEVVISLIGPGDIKLASHGLPRPVLLRLHPASTFNDMTYLARQVFVFASHSWRSFFPSPMPVTILYSDLVAKLLPELLGVNDSVMNAMLGRIGRTRWFL